MAAPHKMNILVTGASGFVGKNLLSQLRNIRDGKAKNYAVEGDLTLYEYDLGSTPEELDLYCRNADFVFNLAGVNRPQDPAEFMKGNFGFASTLLDTLKKHGNTCPVMISSSIQASLDNPYGESKRAGEQLLFDYAEETGAKVLVYRFPNLFGKWCRPNYNSAVATFCNNIANDLPITVNDPSVELHLVYIDDVVDELIGALTGANTVTGISALFRHRTGLLWVRSSICCTRFGGCPRRWRSPIQPKTALRKNSTRRTSRTFRLTDSLTT